MRTTVIAIVTTGTLGFSAVGVGLLSPAFADSSQPKPTQEQAGNTAMPVARQSQSTRAGVHHDAAARGVSAGVLGTSVADVLLMTSSELRAKMRNGQSLADIAAEQGVDRARVVDALTQAQVQRFEALIETDDVSEQQKQSIRQHVEKIVDRSGAERGR